MRSMRLGALSKIRWSSVATARWSRSTKTKLSYVWPG